MPRNGMKYVFFTIFALLIACRDEIPQKTYCLSMTISDALPVQFWLNGCSTYNETVSDGVFIKCFCQQFECDDTINFQFTDDSGDSFTLDVIDSNDNLLTSILFDKYQNVYSTAFTPSSIGCDQTIKFQISRTETVAELLEDPEFDIGGSESLNFANPDFSAGSLASWEQPAFGAFGPISPTSWVYQSDGGNQIARFDASVSAITTTKFLSQPKPGGGSWPKGTYQFAYHVANLSASGTNNVDILLVAVFEDLTYQLLDTKNPASGAGFVSYTTSVAITKDAVGIGIIAKRNTAGSDLDVKINDLSISAPVQVDSIWQNVDTVLGAAVWGVNAGVASVPLVTSSKSFVAPFSDPVPVGSTLTIISQMVLPASNTYNISVFLYDQDGVNVQVANIAFGQAPGTFNINFPISVSGVNSPNPIYSIGIFVDIASSGAVPANVQVNYFRLSGSTTSVEANSDCIEIAESWPNSLLLEYSNRRNYAGIINDGSAGTPDQTTFALRIPAVFFIERYPETSQVETLSNNRDILLNSQIEVQRLLDVGYVPFYMHKKIQLVLTHQFLAIEGRNWVKKETYEIADGNKRNSTRKAQCYLNDRDYVVRNIL